MLAKYASETSDHGFRSISTGHLRVAVFLVECRLEERPLSIITFDTLKFVERLEKAGVPREQASAMAEAFKDASGEAEIATRKDIGLGRESLYKALAPGAKPRYDTVLKVVRALGVTLHASVTHAPAG
jgi:probable addiction module antidote protein